MTRPFARSGTARTAPEPVRRIVAATSSLRTMAGSLKTSTEATARPSTIAIPDGPTPADSTGAMCETSRKRPPPASVISEPSACSSRSTDERTWKSPSTLSTIRWPTSRGSRLSVKDCASRASSSASRRRRVDSV